MVLPSIIFRAVIMLGPSQSRYTNALMTCFKTEVLQTHPSLPARVTRITTSHGEVITPAFMPVGTRAYVNFMTPDDLLQAGSQIILGGNTYHMLCAPGMDIIQHAGGMHRFMGWHKPMLTDSGGFQVFSLSKNKKFVKLIIMVRILSIR